MKEAKQEDKNGARATKNHLHLRETKEKEREKKQNDEEQETLYGDELSKKNKNGDPAEEKPLMPSDDTI